MTIQAGFLLLFNVQEIEAQGAIFVTILQQKDNHYHFQSFPSVIMSRFHIVSRRLMVSKLAALSPFSPNRTFSE